MAGGDRPGLLGQCRSSYIESFLVLLLLVVYGGIQAVSEELLDRALEADRHSCFETVSSWSDEQLHRLSSLPPESALDRVKLQDLLFFLHIPRTGGRTLYQCFLKHILPSDQRCPRSYDRLRIDRSHPGCRLISTHDDYSLLDNLPLDTTSVVTSLREPLDRVLGSYEFAIEVAARSLRAQKTRPPPFRTSGSKASPAEGASSMSTLDIWPWKYLVPTMEKDLFARRDSREATEMNVTELSADDSYDVGAIAMPFEEFVDHPAAHELVHNGATFQVAGLTNTSYSAEAGVIRQCVVRFPHLGKLVVDVAKKRLDRMLYVGLMERQNDSVLFLAKVLGEQISTKHMMRSMLSSRMGGNRTREPGGYVPRLQANFISLDEFTEEVLIEEMLVSYKTCVANLRKGMESRRAISLLTIKPIKFSRELRKRIPAHVMEKVARLNLLDTELYAYAQVLFQEQQKFLQDGDFHFKKQVQMSRGDVENVTDGLQDSSGFTYSWEILQALWGVTAFWVITILMVLVTLFYVFARRRRNRVKEF